MTILKINITNKFVWNKKNKQKKKKKKCTHLRIPNISIQNATEISWIIWKVGIYEKKYTIKKQNRTKKKNLQSLFDLITPPSKFHQLG